MNLEQLLQEFYQAHGTSRVVAMERLRAYFRANDVRILINEIERLTDPQDFDTLLGVGMKGILFNTVVARRAYLQGV